MKSKEHRTLLAPYFDCGLGSASGRVRSQAQHTGRQGCCDPPLNRLQSVTRPTERVFRWEDERKIDKTEMSLDFNLYVIGCFCNLH